MNSLSIALRALMTATAEKAQAKVQWTEMSSSDENYIAARDKFRAKDDECESLVVSLIDTIRLAREDDDFVGVVENLEEEELRFLRNTLEARGMSELLDARPVGFPELLNKVRKAAAAWTAAKQVNELRKRYDVDAFEHEVKTAPANILDKDWQKAVLVLRGELAKVRAEWGDDVDASVCLREAACEAERKARLVYDKLCDVLAGEVQDMLARGTFDFEISDMDADVRAFARDFCRRVPQPQAVPVAQPKSRWEPEVETLAKEDLDAFFGNVDSFLAGN